MVLIAAQELLGYPGDPFSRRRFDPGHFTASAFVLSPDGGSIVMIRHRRLDRWLQPGGHVEAHDRDVKEAARREAIEEAGRRWERPAGSRSGPRPA